MLPTHLRSNRQGTNVSVTVMRVLALASEAQNQYAPAAGWRIEVAAGSGSVDRWHFMTGSPVLGHLGEIRMANP